MAEHQVRAGNRQLMREINEALVLRTVREHGPISRTDVAQQAHLSPATVSDITGLLIAKGLLYERSSGLSTGGRRPVLLAVNDDAGLVIGVKVTEFQLVVALTNLGATVLDRRVAPLDGGARPEAVVAALAPIVADLQRSHPERHILGVGLGLAGVVDRRTGMCRFSPILGWRDVAFRDLLEAGLHLPVVIENDVNTLTLAEQWFGRGVGEPDFVVVTVGRGVGMGMVLNGRLYRGGAGGGGELGHLTMEAGGPVCSCGKRGCLEALVAEPALLERLRRATGSDLGLEEAANRARQGDPVAGRVFDAAGRTLGLALAHVVNLVNPPLIILGGEGLPALPPMSPALRATLAEECFEGFFDDLTLVEEPWGDDAWARGAASLMLEELFSPTLHAGSVAPVGSSLAGALSGR